MTKREPRGHIKSVTTFSRSALGGAVWGGAGCAGAGESVRGRRTIENESGERERPLAISPDFPWPMWAAPDVPPIVRYRTIETVSLCIGDIVSQRFIYFRLLILLFYGNIECLLYHNSNIHFAQCSYYAVFFIYLYIILHVYLL